MSAAVVIELRVNLSPEQEGDFGDIVKHAAGYADDLISRLYQCTGLTVTLASPDGRPR